MMKSRLNNSQISIRWLDRGVKRIVVLARTVDESTTSLLPWHHQNLMIHQYIWNNIVLNVYIE